MKTTWWVIGAAVAGVAVGASFSGWRSPPAAALPVPSEALLSELAPTAQSGPLRIAISPEQVERLKKQTAAIAANTAEFRTELSTMEEHYRDRLEAVLNEAQRKKLQKGSASAAVSLPAPASSSGVPRPGDVMVIAPFPGQGPAATAAPALAPEMLRSILELTFVSWSLENLRTELELSDDQAARVRDLLIERRARFLELADRLPPPTLRLLNLGRELQRLGLPPE